MQARTTLRIGTFQRKTKILSKLQTQIEICRTLFHRDVFIVINTYWLTYTINNVYCGQLGRDLILAKAWIWVAVVSPAQIQSAAAGIAAGQTEVVAGSAGMVAVVVAVAVAPAGRLAGEILVAMAMGEAVVVVVVVEVAIVVVGVVGAALVAAVAADRTSVADNTLILVHTPEVAVAIEVDSLAVCQRVVGTR